MFTDLLPMLVTTVAVLMGVVLFVIATQETKLRPDTVAPFGPVGTEERNSSSDTMVNQEMLQTVLSQRPDWKLATLNNLRDAEDLLDYLENHNYQDRELHTLGNNCFAVRWK